MLDHSRKSFILTVEVGEVVRLELVVVLVDVVVELTVGDELVVDTEVVLVLVEVSGEEGVEEVVV